MIEIARNRRFYHNDPPSDDSMFAPFRCIAGDRQAMSKLKFKATLIAAALLVLFAIPVVGQQVETQPADRDSVQQQKIDAKQEIDDAKKLDDFLTQLALDSMPVRYVEDKDWGKQKERWDGIKVSFKNGRLHTKRRKKMVNHGTWDRYEVSLVDPENSFSVQLNNFEETDSDRVTFDVIITAKVNVVARQAKWVKGVQLYSISADGSAAVKLAISASLGSRLDVAKFPPDLIFDPRIEDAKIELEDFRIDRVSKAGGEFAQQVTRIVKSKLDKKVAPKEEKLVKKLNAKIEKNRDRLTLSANDAVKSKWAAAAQKLTDKEEE